MSSDKYDIMEAGIKPWSKAWSINKCRYSTTHEVRLHTCLHPTPAELPTFPQGPQKQKVPNMVDPKSSKLTNLLFPPNRVFNQIIFHQVITHSNITNDGSGRANIKGQTLMAFVVNCDKNIFTSQWEVHACRTRGSCELECHGRESGVRHSANIVAQYHRSLYC